MLVKTKPGDFETGTAALVQDVSAAVTNAAFTFALNPDVKPVPVPAKPVSYTHLTLPTILLV